MRKYINFVSIPMKFHVTAIVIFASFTSASGQSDCLDDSLKYKNVYMKRVHNVIGLVPSKARVTNGWAIGWEASLDNYCMHMDSIRINGLHTNVFLPQAYIAGMSLIMAPFYPKMLLENFEVDTLTRIIHEKVMINDDYQFKITDYQTISSGLTPIIYKNLLAQI